jgi:hypothetical protein
MVGDWLRPATMQAAWRPEEELDNRLRPATMQAAWRAEEELDNRLGGGLENSRTSDF